jgi:hypothetical protein
LLIASATVCGRGGSTPTPSPSGSLEIKDGFYVLHLRGSAEEMGRQHGTLLKDQISEFLQDYLFDGILEKYGVPWSTVVWTARLYEAAMPEDFKTELEAIAEGAGVSYEAILVCQLGVDLPLLITQATTMGGTSFIAKGGATSGETVIHGANVELEDFNNSLHDHLTIIYYEPTDGNRFVSLSSPGSAGVVIGMNEKHLALSASVVEAGYDQTGLAASVNLRRTLQYSNTLSEAATFLAASTRTRGYAVSVSCGSPEGLFVTELSPNYDYKRETGTFEALVSVDHFISQEMQPHQDGTSPADSIHRYDRLVELITQNYGSITGSSAQSFMSDRNDPHGDNINSDWVVYSSVLLPKELTFWVAKGPVSSEADYVSFSLEE